MLLSDGSRLELPPPALPFARALADTAAAAAAAPRAMMAAIEKSVAPPPPPEPEPPAEPPDLEAAMAAAAAAAAAIAAGFCVPSSIAAVASLLRNSPICSPKILLRLPLARPLSSSRTTTAADPVTPPLRRRGFEVSILRPFRGSSSQLLVLFSKMLLLVCLLQIFQNRHTDFVS